MQRAQLTPCLCFSWMPRDTTVESHGSCLVLFKSKLPAAKPLLMETSQYPARGTEGAKQDTVNSIFS